MLGLGVGLGLGCPPPVVQAGGEVRGSGRGVVLHYSVVVPTEARSVWILVTCRDPTGCSDHPACLPCLLTARLLLRADVHSLLRASVVYNQSEHSHCKQSHSKDKHSKGKHSSKAYTLCCFAPR